MLESTMLLISDDRALGEAVRSAGRSIANLKLTVLAGTDLAYSYQAWDRVDLILIHQKRRVPATGVDRLLRMIAAARRPIATLVVADEADEEQGRTLVRLGVADYIARPVDPGRLAHLIEVLTLRTRLALRAESGPSAPSAPPGFDDESPETARLMSLVRRVAPQDTTILLGGETGTGKSRLARVIHDLSARRDGPFLVVNCGALSADPAVGGTPDPARGTPAGAGGDLLGRFAEAGRGTLFLDEVDGLPMAAQARLLRLIEDRAHESPGPGGPRLIASSSRDLDREVSARRFRSDLFYRLNVVGLNLPLLRDRGGAIPILVDQFLAEFAARNGSRVDSISDDALRVLQEHDWPGNVRELRNVIERAVVLGTGRQIGRDDLPESVFRGASWTATPPMTSTSRHPILDRSTLDQIRQEAEMTRISEALAKHRNNRLRTANELGISRMTLYKKLYKYGLMNQDEIHRGGVA